MSDTRTPAHHTVIMRPSRYADDIDSWNSDDSVQLRIYSRYVRRPIKARVGFTGPAGAARRVRGGPLVPGPYGYLVPQATVISARRDPNPPKIVDVQDGDFVHLVCVGRDPKSPVNVFVAKITDDRASAYPRLAFDAAEWSEPAFELRQPHDGPNEFQLYDLGKDVVIQTWPLDELTEAVRTLIELNDQALADR